MSDALDRITVHWLALTPKQRAAMICRCTAGGWSDHAIATMTRLSVEAVQAIRAEHPHVTSADLGETPPFHAPAFQTYPQEAQEGAVCLMVGHGLPADVIAAATGFTVEQIRLIRARRMLCEAIA